jgi:hypothetical protein
MRTWQSYKWYYVGAGIFLSILILWGIVSQKGFGLGELTVNVTVQNSIILIDEKEVEPHAVDGSRVTYRLRAGTHSVINGSDGFFPWTNEVTIIKNENTEITPFLVPESSSGFFIGKEDPEFSDIVKSFKSPKPTEALPIESASGMKLWVDENFVLLENENGTAVIYNGDEAPHYVDFYKERDDVYIIASGTKVFVIDGNVDTFQNFMPIHSGELGVRADFRVKNESQLYIKNGNTYLIVSY